ncbi:MAG: Nif3-like dinuclear metal center hexameric protein [Phycisphaerae bacterium]
MKVSEIINQIEEVVPLKLSQSWDNVGLLIGEQSKQVRNLFLTIDITKAVLAEAKRCKAQMILSYHPVIWDGLKKINPDGPAGVVHELIRSEIAVYSVHTALDAVQGGVNDALAEIVGIKNPKPLGDYVDSAAAVNYKLVVFVPVKAADKVANAIFSAGAGWIGNYSRCSFQASGKGTFLPMDGAKPAIGKKGKLEEVDEIRLECIVPEVVLNKVVEAMKKAHPYEEPAFDIFRLYNPQEKIGLGRIGQLAEPMKIEQIIKRIKRYAGAKAVGIVGESKRTVKKAAVCAGSCGKIINSVISCGAELYVTGEIKHHQAIAAQEQGLTCLCLSHTVSERFILKKLAKQLQKRLKTVKISVSKADNDPFVWKQI